MEVHRVLVGGGFDPVDTYRAAAFGLGRQVAWLAPFQGFLNRADAPGGLRSVEDQAPQRQ
jgi:hypothetical protein